jgi:3-oxoadipate enol-lactonase
MSSTLTLGDGTRIRYRIDGPDDAPVLVLSNSIATTLEMWDVNVPDLAPAFRLVRYDTRGHGLSDAPAGAYSVERLGRDVVELLDALSVDRAHFCGLSLGGLVGQWLGVHAPERLNRLILANTSAYLGPSPRWDAQIHGIRLSRDLTDVAEMFLSNWFPLELLAEESTVEPFREALVNMQSTGLLGCMAAVRDADMRRTIALIQAPTLVIIGEQDTVCLPDHGALIARTVPAAQTLYLSAKHLSNVEDPRAFVNGVRRFLATD